MPNNAAFAVDATLQSQATANGNGTAMSVGGLTGVTLQVAGTFSATISPEGTLNGSDWPSPGLFAINLSTGVVASTITAAGLYFVPTPGIDQFRARVSGYASGFVTITAKGVQATSPFILLGATPGGTPAPVNLSQVGNAAVALGQQGMANSLPVTIASNQSNLPITGAADVTATVGIAGLNQTSSIACQGLTSVSAVITGTWAATLTPQVSVDGGTTWKSTQFYNPSTQQFSATISSNGTYQIVGTGGTSHVQVVATAFTSGSVGGTLRASSQAGDVVTAQSLPSIWDPVASAYTLARAATADGMAPATVPAEATALWNGASLDRQRTPNTGTGDALTSDMDLRALLWLAVLELSRLRLGLSILTEQDLADAMTTVDLEA